MLEGASRPGVLALYNTPAMRFTKYHGAGNDFLIVEADGGTADWPALALAMCERHTGVGADGLLVVEASAKAAHRMVLFNADGSEAEMSGNGIRCFAKHVIEELGAPRDMLTIETLAGLHEITPRFENGQVVAARVGMGAPRFDPAQIPVTARGVERVIDYPLQVGEASLRITSLSMGNPHAVAFIDEPVEDWPLERVGPLVERDPFFPRRVNFEIVNVESPERLRARVWERGASETLACGSGASAAAVAAQIKGLAGESVVVSLPGGELKIDWDGEGEVWLEGPVARVFSGDWPL